MRPRNNFECLRILAALVVIYGHAFPLTATSAPSLFFGSIQAVAVKIFFSISGYLVTKSLMKDGDITNYLSKRIRRIFPGLIVVVIVCAFVIGPLVSTLDFAQYFGSPTFKTYFRNIFMYPVYNLPGVFESNSYPVAVNGSLWSLPVEFLMYLVLVPVFMLTTMANRISLILVAITTCAASLYFTHLVPGKWRYVVYGSDLIMALDVIPYFFIGGCLARFMIPGVLDMGWALFLVLLISLMQVINPVLAELALYAVGPYVIISFAVSSTPFLREAGKYGDPSYGIYLYGFPVQQCIIYMCGGHMSPVLNAIISIPICIGLGYLSWHFVEKRFLPAVSHPLIKRGVV
ncbi:acyltransferase family protein [Pseudomonas japonica]|uniref:acyltransferase family protein n=1 Tax=Pseudomonas japonica TaxID=256466 RepID=UPI0015E34FB2|nr:acyltransferase [Pseudomonas japonica]MBA1241967.1 acyltransferase [Pseudomonas japonica]